MPALVVNKLSRAEIKQHPEWLYVFGDNFERRGLGGQAKECRGEPNAVGIPTKRAPSQKAWAFLTDGDYDVWVRETAADWARIAEAMDNGQTVVWPANGIGTGLAELKKRAPKIWRELQGRIATLQGPAF